MKRSRPISIVTPLCIGLLLTSLLIRHLFINVIIYLLVIGILFFSKKNQILLMRANRAYAKGDLETCFALSEKYLTLPKATMLPKIVYSYRLLKQGELDKAYTLLQSLEVEKCNAVEKRNYNAVFGLILFKKGNCSRAIERYEAIFNEKANQPAYETLGYLYLAGKRYHQALIFNQKAHEAYPESDEIKNNLACSYYFNDLYPEAAELFDELMASDTSFLEPYYYYALMLDEQGDSQDAIEILNRACDKPASYLHTLNQEMIHEQLLLCQSHISHAIDE